MSRYKQPYSLYKRGDYWYYRTYDIAGLRTSGKTTGQTSKSAAKAYCDKLYLEGRLSASNMTFGEYASKFFDDDSFYVKDRIKPLAENTLIAYRNLLSNILLPVFENVKLADMNYTRLKSYRVELLKSRPPAYVTKIMSTLKIIVTCAFRDRIIPINPFDYIEPLKYEENVRDAFRLDEIIELYDLIPLEFKNIILLMALTGMRISEAVGITEADYKKTDKCEFIDLTKQYNKGKYKGLKMDSKRQIPIIPEIKELNTLDPTRISVLYKKYNELKTHFNNYEERQLSFHSLRHFFETNAKAFGVPEVKVKYLSGHKLDKIERIYTNFKADDVIEIIQWQTKVYEQIKNPPCQRQ